MPYNILAVEKLRLELEKTAVISDKFRDWLVGIALGAYQEGRDDGRREEKGETLKAYLKRKGFDSD